MMEYISKKSVDILPRLPLEGSIDLTYRCNNNCRHCWLWIPPDSPEKKNELTFDEIKGIVDEARHMGCRKWNISGGEPMLRPDFVDIFDYLTRNSALYTLNTNGTLITPKIARLMKRKGSKLIALYGATSGVHDNITRIPGSFEAFIKGISYLQEAGVSFTIQIVPMKDNYHQFQEIIQFAESLSPDWRIGASWLYLSAYGDEEKNKEIRKQRLDPSIVVELDKPNINYEEWLKETRPCDLTYKKNFLFSDCISNRRNFCVDPYGQMSFCSFVKDSSLKYNLRTGHFKEAWNEAFPSFAKRIKTNAEYNDGCGSCELRNDCRWCPVYGFLEHGRHSAKVDYFCRIARENRIYKDRWKKHHRRCFQVAGITIQVDFDLPIQEDTFAPKLLQFEVKEPGEDLIRLHHHFSLPQISDQDLGKVVYTNGQISIYDKNESWIYYTKLPDDNDDLYTYQISVFNKSHTRARIYNCSADRFNYGKLPTLTLFSTDQLLLSRLLAERNGCCLHSSGVILNKKGFLFVGHSGAGKSTMVKLLNNKAEILCDDRMIIRKWEDRFKIHGNWSHGEIPQVSAAEAPFNGIFFLEKSHQNSITLLEDNREKIKRLLACLIKPLMTGDWWEGMLTIVEKIVKEIPCYMLYFDKSGRIIDSLNKI